MNMFDLPISHGERRLENISSEKSVYLNLTDEEKSFLKEKIVTLPSVPGVTFHNKRNSCYFNTLMQILYSFKDVLIEDLYEINKISKLAESLTKSLFVEMHEAEYVGKSNNQTIILDPMNLSFYKELENQEIITPGLQDDPIDILTKVIMRISETIKYGSIDSRKCIERPPNSIVNNVSEIKVIINYNNKKYKETKDKKYIDEINSIIGTQEYKYNSLAINTYNKIGEEYKLWKINKNSINFFNSFNRAFITLLYENSKCTYCNTRFKGNIEQCISFSINRNTGNDKSLQELLNEKIKFNVSNKQNKSESKICSNCHKRGKIFNSIIVKPPKILIIQINDFIDSINGIVFNNIETVRYFEFPETLSLKSHCYDQNSKLINCNLNEKCYEKEFIYDTPQFIIRHGSSFRSGHYSALINEDNIYYEYDDTHKTKCYVNPLKILPSKLSYRPQCNSTMRTFAVVYKIK